jgi:hypothetical protein
MTSPNYAAHGGMNSVVWGNNLTESRAWNYRLQPASISVGSQFNLLYYYCSNEASGMLIMGIEIRWEKIKKAGFRAICYSSVTPVESNSQ